MVKYGRFFLEADIFYVTLERENHDMNGGNLNTLVCLRDDFNLREDMIGWVNMAISI